jgi:hypothetical protein
MTGDSAVSIADDGQILRTPQYATMMRYAVVSVTCSRHHNRACVRARVCAYGNLRAIHNVLMGKGSRSSLKVDAG